MIGQYWHQRNGVIGNAANGVPRPHLLREMVNFSEVCIRASIRHLKYPAEPPSSNHDAGHTRWPVRTMVYRRRLRSRRDANLLLPLPGRRSSVRRDPTWESRAREVSVRAAARNLDRRHCQPTDVTAPPPGRHDFCPAPRRQAATELMGSGNANRRGFSNPRRFALLHLFARGLMAARTRRAAQSQQSMPQKSTWLMPWPVGVIMSSLHNASGWKV